METNNSTLHFQPTERNAHHIYKYLYPDICIFLENIHQFYFARTLEACQGFRNTEVRKQLVQGPWDSFDSLDLHMCILILDSKDWITTALVPSVGGKKNHENLHLGLANCMNIFWS